MERFTPSRVLAVAAALSVAACIEQTPALQGPVAALVNGEAIALPPEALATLDPASAREGVEAATDRRRPAGQAPQQGLERDTVLADREAAPSIEQHLAARGPLAPARTVVRKSREKAKIEYVGDFGAPREERAAAASPAPPSTHGQATSDGTEKGTAGLH